MCEFVTVQNHVDFVICFMNYFNCDRFYGTVLLLKDKLRYRFEQVPDKYLHE